MHYRPAAVRKTNPVLPGGPAIFRRPLRVSATGYAGRGSRTGGSGAGGADAGAEGEGQQHGGGAGSGDAAAALAQREAANKLLKHKRVMTVGGHLFAVVQDRCCAFLVLM
jgi:hypothetical protein